MPKVSDIITSNFLKGTDLVGREHEATIEGVELVNFDNGPKLVVSFVGKPKKLTLNKTNAGFLQSALGDETEKWAGQQVMLFTQPVMYQGTLHNGIRVRLPQPVAASLGQTPGGF